MLDKTLKPKIFSKKLPRASLRDAFGEALIEEAQSNQNIVVVSADLAESTRVERFKLLFPKRFFEVGVAEQNLAGVAAGLALSGKIPVATSFAVFSPGRNWEQIRISICYNQANVKIVGTHAGLVTGPDGATHQALEDIAITRVLPNLTVIAPSDFEQTKQAVREMLKLNGPVYLRLPRISSPVFTTEKTPFEIGRANLLRAGKDLTIIACGPLVYDALVAAEKLAKIGLDAEVIDCHTIKPLDEKTILKSVKKTNCVLTLEDHQKFGGLGGAISEFLSQNYPVNMEIMGVDDTFGESGEAAELLEKYGLTAEQVIKKSQKLVRRSRKK